MTTRSSEYLRGYRLAKEHLQKEDAKKLRGQASSDLYPDDFTKGWKAACDEVAGGLDGRESQNMKEEK